MQYEFTVELVFSNENITFSRGNGLMELTMQNESVADNILPTYGIIGRTGKLKLIDYKDLLYNKILNREYPIEINIYQNGVLFARFISTKKYAYNIYTKEITIEASSNITNWQNINVTKTEISYDVTAYDILVWLISKQTITSLDTVNLPSDTKAHLESITVPYFYLETGTLWEQFQKLCDLAQLRIYQDRFNVINIQRYR